ncbi:MAG: phospho-sugar mutase [Bacteroidetes bacterium]|nr:MAG: phospho-sugar mutase [Bacteroidota bacterium]REK57997.1 MAG: phospho-sugar mutase [Bacteroidota bacterium]
MSTDVLSLATKNATLWTSDIFDEATRAEAQALLDKGGDDLIEPFYKDLDFGTGGMRGIMGVGTNRINPYTLGTATTGLINYAKETYGREDLKAVIAYDSRNNSQAFARKVAEVLSANGVYTYLFEELRPTPELSFAVRELGCDFGIVLTASHNPKEYNGYKVYWNDGGQLVPPHDGGVIAKVRQTGFEDINWNANEDLIETISEAIDSKYIANVVAQSLNNDGKEDLKVVFTALHGTSIVSVPPALKASGFTNVHIVEEQATPDGNFPTVDSPNPEEGAALAMGIAQAEASGSDIVIGCDPDTDRVGIAVNDGTGKMQLLNGNDTAALLVHYVLSQADANHAVPENPFTAATVVTTDLIAKISERYNIPCFRCLTGFKWIADIINNKPEMNFMVGGEESYGYLIGDSVRDKDAVASAVMIAEMAAYAKAQGRTVLEQLEAIHREFGQYQERLISITKKGRSGAQEIADMMTALRNDPPKTLAGSPVVIAIDHSNSTQTDLRSGTTSSTELPASNVLQFITEAGDKVSARPSGTEPKIKFYFSVCTTTGESHAETKAELERKIDTFIEELAL